MHSRDLASLAGEETIFGGLAAEKLKRLQVELDPLSRRYDVVVANPPYMGSSNMNGWLSGWTKKRYKEVCKDLCTCFIKRGFSLSDDRGYEALITSDTCMYISSFEKMRKEVIERTSIVCFIDTRGTNAHPDVFDANAGWVLWNHPGANIKGSYFKLNHPIPEKSQRLLEALANPDCGWFYRTNASGFEAIPGSPIAYWISRKAANLFAGTSIADYGFAGIGMRTGDNARFLRFWFEVGFETIGIGIESAEAQIASYSKWIPYNKGGEFRKWYGNNEYVVNWFNNGEEIKENTKRVYPELGDDLGWKISNERYYFKPGITWTGVTSGAFHCRCYEKGFIFDSGANGLFPFNSFDRFYLAGLLNTGMADAFLKVLNPTINCGAGTLRLVPAIINNSKRDRVAEIVHECIDLAKDDWDAFETSWEYGHHPLVR